MAGEIHIEFRDRQMVAILRDVARAIGFRFRIETDPYEDLVLESPPELAEASRFYAADGSFVEMDPAEVRRRRIGAAQEIVRLQGELAQMVRRERDRLAELALPAIIQGSDPVGDEELVTLAQVCAEQAYLFADAMLAEREKGGGRG